MNVRTDKSGVKLPDLAFLLFSLTPWMARY